MNKKQKLSILAALMLTVGGCTPESPPPFAVGDCVRIIGYNTIEKVTVVLPSGKMEVKGKTFGGHEYLSVYDFLSPDLIKVECPRD